MESALYGIYALSMKYSLFRTLNFNDNVFYLSTLITKRWQTAETEVNRSIWSAEMQSPDWCKILHAMNSGMLANPVIRSERARLHSNRFVIVLKCFFFNTREKTFKMFKNIVKTKSTSRKFAVNRTSVFLVPHDFDIRRLWPEWI